MKRKKLLQRVVALTLILVALVSQKAEAATYLGVAPKTQGQFYNYCPAILQYGDKTYMYYCANADAKSTDVDKARVKDRICLRIQQSNQQFGAEKVVLRPGDASKNEWDAYHVCDPSVIMGSFTFNKKKYSYLMAYLGCATIDANNNGVGLAVSNDGISWTKVNKKTPFIQPEIPNSWGSGQPSLIKIGNEYGVAYTVETEVDGGGGKMQRVTRTKVKYINTNNLADTSGTTFKIKRDGTMRDLKPTDPVKTEFISNADFAMGTDGYMYIICDQHSVNGFPDKDLYPVAKNSMIYKSSKVCNSIADLKKCTWVNVDVLIGVDKFRCHNAGFFRNKDGVLSANKVAYTESIETGAFDTALWSYRICFAKIKTK